MNPFSLQLYELSDDQKRKEFLDDLFAFMQKRGKNFFTRQMQTCKPLVREKFN